MKKTTLSTGFVLSLFLLNCIAGCGGSSQSTTAYTVADPQPTSSASSGGTTATGSGTNSLTGGVSTGTATLTWDAPQYQDAATAPTLSGYKIHYGTSPDALNQVVDVGSTNSYTISNLPSGTYYFAVTDYDASGKESSLSNVMSKTISAS